MNQVYSVLLLGFLLGIKHAFDTDHIAAISTFAAENKHPLKAALVGAFWGMGHTTTLFFSGMLVLLLRIKIPENVTLVFEFMVGLMLILLGFNSLSKIVNQPHMHTHRHGEKDHVHTHSSEDKKHHHRHKRSFFVGTIHGLAGSGALTLLVLASTPSVYWGMIYILIFGFGSIVSMSLVRILFGLPFVYAGNKLPIVEKYLKVSTGFFSMILGTFLAYKIGFDDKLLLSLFGNI